MTILIKDSVSIQSFTLGIVFSSEVFTLLQKKEANYSLKGKNCEIIPKIRFLEKLPTRISSPVKLQKNQG